MKHDELAILNPATLPAKAVQIPLKPATCSSPPKGNQHPAVSVFSNSNLLRDRKAGNVPTRTRTALPSLLRRGCGRVSLEGWPFSLLSLLVLAGRQKGQRGLELSHRSTGRLPARCRGAEHVHTTEE